MNMEQKLYKLIEKNETEEAIAILQLPDLKLQSYDCQEDDGGTGKGCTNWSMLQWACYHGNEQIVQKLLQYLHKEYDKERDQDASQSSSLLHSSNLTPMHIAAQKNHLSICWLLLTHSIPDFKSMNQIKDDDDIPNIISFILHQVDKQGNTPLHTAASNGHEKLVKWFLDVGSNRRIKNAYNFTPLDVASNKHCRTLLRCQHDDSIDNVKQEMIDSNNSFSLHNAEKVKLILQKYLGFKTKLMALVSSNNGIRSTNDIGDTAAMSDSINNAANNTTNFTTTTDMYDSTNNILDLNQIQDLIDDATEFGLTRDMIDKSLLHLKWLKVKRDIWIHIQDVKDNAPIITPTKYSFVNDLKQIIHDVQYCDDVNISDINNGDDNAGNGQNENEKVSNTTSASIKIADDNNENTQQQEQQKTPQPTQQPLSSPPFLSLLPEAIRNVIETGLALCDQSTAEFNLHKACQECKKISCTIEMDNYDDSDGDDDTNTNASANRKTSSTFTTIMMDILQKTIHNAKNVNANTTLIEEGELLHSRILSEQSLLEAKNSTPKNIKLPPPAETPMTSKQAKLYWVDVVDIGYIQETEGYPLPPLLSEGDDGVDTTKNATSSNSTSNPDKVGDYIWIKSESLQSLEASLMKIEQRISNATSFGANSELIESCQMLLKEKRDNDLKALIEKDQVDRVVALAVTEKAAKKLLKKKKKKGSNK